MSLIFRMFAISAIVDWLIPNKLQNSFSHSVIYLSHHSSRNARRSYKGAMLNEFPVAMALLISCVLLPLANIAAVPFRYLIAYALVSDLTHKLSLCERRSQALAAAINPDNYQDLSRKMGIVMDDVNVSIVCENQRSEIITLPDEKPIPSGWLPGGNRGQCNYYLQTAIDMQIPPLICSGPKIVGVTAPWVVTFRNVAPWENLGCDPATQQFYLNE